MQQVLWHQSARQERLSQESDPGPNADNKEPGSHWIEGTSMSCGTWVEKPGLKITPSFIHSFEPCILYELLFIRRNQEAWLQTGT